MTQVFFIDSSELPPQSVPQRSSDSVLFAKLRQLRM